MNIRINDKYELRRLDAMNWQLWKYKKLDGGKNKGSMAWVAMGRYYQTLSQALKAVYEFELRENAGSLDLKQAIKTAIQIERDLERVGERNRHLMEGGE